jgi:YgiT-type zinc finger domain-containing protein
MAEAGGLDARVQQEVMEIVSGLWDWRAAHLRATFAEMEREVDERFNAARARVLQEMALMSRAADLSGAAPAERARCPSCGGALKPQGRKGRTVVVQGGNEVRLERDYALCPSCGTGLFPPR